MFVTAGKGESEGRRLHWHSSPRGCAVGASFGSFFFSSDKSKVLGLDGQEELAAQDGLARVEGNVEPTKNRKRENVGCGGDTTKDKIPD